MRFAKVSITEAVPLSGLSNTGSLSVTWIKASFLYTQYMSLVTSSQFKDGLGCIREFPISVDCGNFDVIRKISCGAFTSCVFLFHVAIGCFSPRVMAQSEMVENIT